MTQSMIKGKTDCISSNWKPRLVKTPVPIMDATTNDAAVQTEIWRPDEIGVKDQER